MSAPELCSRCGFWTYCINQQEETVDHPDCQAAMADALKRAVYRIQNLEAQVDSLVAVLDGVREGRHQPIAFKSLAKTDGGK